ncbi:hypothetical protein [Bradyrhizobium sp. SYSU BS000235]|uniref:hypothetical protein n=1 Tax=Bradyrhizobium sp. SYSU BS000235 TaxID=3411332 RepID=UPI003C76E30B
MKQLFLAAALLTVAASGAVNAQDTGIARERRQARVIYDTYQQCRAAMSGQGGECVRNFWHTPLEAQS